VKKFWYPLTEIPEEPFFRKGIQKMFENLIVDTHKVLVEMTVVPLGSNGQVSDQIAEILSLVDKSGLFYEYSHGITSIEGEWSEISSLIYACYESIQDRFPEGFLRISIR